MFEEIGLKQRQTLCRLLLPIHNIGYVKSIPSTEHHKNGYWWRRRGVWVAASAFLKKIRCALHTIYTVERGIMSQRIVSLFALASYVYLSR